MSSVRKSRGGAAAILALAAIPAIASAAPSLYTSVDAYATAGPDGAPYSGTWNGGTDQFSGGPSQTSNRFAEFTRTDVLSPPEDRTVQQPVTWDAKATEVSNVSAEYGHLHAYAAVSSSTIPYTVTLEGYGLNGSPYADTWQTIAGAGAESTLQARSSDVLTVAGLPNGTPVDVRVTLHLDATSTTSAPAVVGNYTFTPQTYASLTLSPGSDGMFFPGGSVNVTMADPTFTETLHLQAGDVINPFLSMGAHAYVTEAISVGNNQIVIDPGGSATIDAANTGSVYFDVLTPGASLTSDSGHDYASPTPEPASLLAVCGVALLPLRRRRRG